MSFRRKERIKLTATLNPTDSHGKNIERQTKNNACRKILEQTQRGYEIERFI